MENPPPEALFRHLWRWVLPSSWVFVAHELLNYLEDLPEPLGGHDIAGVGP